MSLLACAFQDASQEGKHVEDADGTNFVINIDNGRTLGFSAPVFVKYADLVSNGEGMRVAGTIVRGIDIGIESPLMIVPNETLNYGIRGSPENLERVSHRTCPKPSIHMQVMPEWVPERKLLSELRHSRPVYST